MIRAVHIEDFTVGVMITSQMFAGAAPDAEYGGPVTAVTKPQNM